MLKAYQVFPDGFSFLPNRSALLDQQQLPRLHPTGVNQTRQIDPRCDCDAPLVATLPNHLVPARRLHLVHQRAHHLPQGVVDPQPHRTGRPQAIGDLSAGVERIGHIGNQTVGRRLCPVCLQWFDTDHPHTAPDLSSRTWR